MRRDPGDVLVLTDAGGEVFLLSRATLTRAAIDGDAGMAADDRTLRVLGRLDPAFAIANLGIRTLGGVPALVIDVPGILDDGEGRLVLDEDGGRALVSEAMLDNVRVRADRHDAVRRAIVAAEGDGGQ